MKNWKCTYAPFYRAVSIANELLGLHLEQKDEFVQDHVVFYNYFLRPASSDRKFIPDELDCEFFGLAMIGVIQKLEPDIVLFLSKKAYLMFQKYLISHSPEMEMPILEHVVHSSSIWWWRNGGCNGYAKMKAILQEKWLYK